jgi:hypothetical protein
MNEPAKPIKIVIIQPPGFFGHEEPGDGPNDETNDYGGNDFP